MPGRRAQAKTEFSRDASLAPLGELDRALRPMLNSMVWGVQFNIDNLSLDFGDPRIEIIHEPVADSRGSGKQPLRGVTNNRRRISVHGRFHLWIYMARWRIVRAGVCLATSSSSVRTMNHAFVQCNGQRLVAATIDREHGCTRLEFDLDTVLEIRRRSKRQKEEVWILYGVSGRDRIQWSLHADGRLERSKLHHGDETRT